MKVYALENALLTDKIWNCRDIELKRYLQIITNFDVFLHYLVNNNIWQESANVGM